MRRLPAVLPGLLSALLLLAFLGLNAAWLGQDRMVRDGDEEGHVGAAEMFRWDLQQRAPGQFLKRALVEDMGDYPSLYPATVGLWWWAMDGLPGRPAVRGVNLGFLLLTAASVAGTALLLRVDRGPALLGGSSVLFLPLNAGIARHFMPEGALVAAVALAILAAAWQRRRPGWGSALLLGLSLGLGLLTKQTFPLYAGLPVLLLLRWDRSLLAAPAGALIAGPWLWNNLGEQLGYAGGSVGYEAGGWLDHALYYPLALWQPALGPVWLVLLALGGLLGFQRRLRSPVVLGLAWLVGGVLVLSLIPKKYDRLLAPLLPATGLVLAAAVDRRRGLSVGVLLGAGWTLAASHHELALAGPSPRAEAFHPGCVQVWLRPPIDDDLGLSRVLEFAATRPPGPVRVIDPPEIPCSVQTTHPWSYHLGPYLRRGGQDREILEEGAGTIEVDFRPNAPGERVDLPLLGVGFSLR
jgi:hypothetical protein